MLNTDAWKYSYRVVLEGFSGWIGKGRDVATGCLQPQPGDSQNLDKLSDGLCLGWVCKVPSIIPACFCVI